MPTATYIPLATLTLTSAQSQVIFSSIPTTGYRDLVLVSFNATQNDAFKQYRLQVNSDTSGVYSDVRMYGNGSSTGSDSSSGAIEMLIYSTGTGTNFATIISQFLDYSATDKHKTILHRSSSPGETVGASVSRYASTNAITSIRVFTPVGQFQVGSTFSLYGIAG